MAKLLRDIVPRQDFNESAISSTWGDKSWRKAYEIDMHMNRRIALQNGSKLRANAKGALRRAVVFATAPIARKGMLNDIKSAQKASREWRHGDRVSGRLGKQMMVDGTLRKKGILNSIARQVIAHHVTIRNIRKKLVQGETKGNK